MDVESGQSHISMSVSTCLANPKDTEMLDADCELRGSLSDDEDSLGEEEAFGSSSMLHSSGIEDEITESLTASGTMPGLAAAAAVVTSRRRQRPHRFETNPSTRKRQYTRLLRKLKHTMHEFCTRCGQQAVLLCVSPGKDNPSFKVFGASPLDQVLRSSQNGILRDLERLLQEKAPSAASRNAENLFELPALIIDGIPTTLEKMNQAQLRMFVPEMLKYSTGRGKPGWGRESTRPIWWPLDVPWANVRRDVRTDDQKLKVPWTLALRQIVKSCYKYHGREDLLHCFPNEPPGIQTDRLSQTYVYYRIFSENSSMSFFLRGPFRPATPSRPHTSAQVNLTPPTLVQTVQNSDGSVSLIQLDSGQTIATITQDQTGQAVATLTTQDGMEGPLAVTMHQVNNTQWSIGAPDPGQGLGVTATVVDAGRNINAMLTTVDQEQQILIDHSNSTLGLIQKQKQQLQGPPTIGLTLNNDGQTVATLHNSGLTSGSRIILSTSGDALEEHGSTAMVQIPVSVYEKIASSIQDSNIGNATSGLDHDDEIDLDTGQNSPTDVSLETLRVDG